MRNSAADRPQSDGDHLLAVKNCETGKSINFLIPLQALRVFFSLLCVIFYVENKFAEPVSITKEITVGQLCLHCRALAE